VLQFGSCPEDPTVGLQGCAMVGHGAPDDGPESLSGLQGRPGMRSVAG
jgi:hypothetical protein